MATLPMTQRPDIDQTRLEQMLRESAAANACSRCPPRSRRTSRRTADGRLEVRCVGCGAELVLAQGRGFGAPRDLP